MRTRRIRNLFLPDCPNTCTWTGCFQQTVSPMRVQMVRGRGRQLGTASNQHSTQGTSFSASLVANYKPQKKDFYRREGKSRRCCLGNKIYTFPCHACYFVAKLIEEQDKIALFWNEIILIDLFQDEIILFFKSSWCKIVRQGIVSILFPKQQQ